MRDSLRSILESDPRIVFAILFGSQARGTAHAHSDVDVAIATRERLGALEIGSLISELEAATLGHDVDLVRLDSAAPSLAWRIFRDGEVIFCRDETALNSRRARAWLEYLDWVPMERIFVEGALRARKLDG